MIIKHRSFWILFWSAVLIGIGLIVFVQIIVGESQKWIVTEPEFAQVVIVPGASVLRNGTPSDILKDRLLTAFDLYHRGIVSKMFVSGDGEGKGYNEVDVMQKFLLDLGVNDEDIILDRSGNDTFQTISHAKQLKLSPLILVTQQFHLPRALFLARSMGLETFGVSSDKHSYQKILSFSVREMFANFKAVWDIGIYKLKKLVLF